MAMSSNHAGDCILPVASELQDEIAFLSAFLFGEQEVTQLKAN